MFNFIEKAKSIYGDAFDYSETNYVNSRTPFYVRCPKHGLLKKDYHHFILRKQGCPYCNREKKLEVISQNASDYKTEYCSIITNAKNRKYFPGSERHHIIPRSLGGLDSEDNLVYLTPSEHYKAHYLLWKFTNTPQMAYAFWRMNMGQHDLISPEEYEELRNKCSEENSKRNSKPVYCLELDKEFKSCREATNFLNKKNEGDLGSVCNGKLKTFAKMHWCWLKDKEEFLKNKEQMLYETEHWQELKNKHISEAKKGKPNPKTVGRHLSEEAKKKISEANKGKSGFWKGKHLSEETKKKLSEAKKGKPGNNLGKHLTEEAKKNLAEKKGIKIQCVETGIIYNSGKEAAIDLGLYPTTGSYIVNRAKENKEYKGVHWKLI